MPIRVIYRGREIEIPESEIRAVELLRKLDLSPLSSIVIRNGEVVSEKDILKEGDEVRVINAISGGA